ncbi:response regulator [Carboxylicivirga sp. N1Y90]|uniref:response regulator n=1 Tax=Carboxylicivirga fragile TaxID=3417571 RepID=UPI003D34F9FC|nr:response regulator transcription factor [Marinilabiliaceae bacterium N1Y90]
MNKSKVYKVILVDDCSEFLEGLQLFFNSLTNYQVIDTVNDGSEIVNHPLLIEADVILMDVNMPKLNGITAGQRVNFQYHNIKMVAITLNKDRVYLEELIRAGFKGFVDKKYIVEELENVLSTVMSNQLAFPKNLLLSLGL